MGWLSLLMAGALEIVWILALKYSDGFARVGPSLVMIVAIGLSFALLGLSLKSVRSEPPMRSGPGSAPRVQSSPASRCSANRPTSGASAVWS